MTLPQPEAMPDIPIRVRTPEERALAEKLSRIGALRLADRICRDFGTTLDVAIRDRHRSPTRARRKIWMLLRHTLDLSYPELEALWGFDHSSIIDGVKKAERELEAIYRRDVA